MYRSREECSPAIGFWLWRHSDKGDPQNLKYIPWKTGLSKMDIDHGVFTMLSDPRRDKPVVGKTKEEVRSKFGELLSLDQMSQYYRGGYRLGWEGKNLLFIKDSVDDCI